MSAWKAKRFWKETAVVEDGAGFRIELDGRPVRSPAKTLLVVPTRALADAIAAEWDAQEGEIKPESMPFTRSANSALDKVTPQFEEVCEMLASYGGSDLLCYRAESPVELVERQAVIWDPLLDWADEKYGVRLAVGAGIMPVAQDSKGQAILAAEVAKLSPFAVAAFHDLVCMSGSLVLALAVIEGRIDAQDAWLASRVDEIWQEEQWGPDDEATETAERKKTEFLTAARLYSLL